MPFKPFQIFNEEVSGHFCGRRSFFGIGIIYYNTTPSIKKYWKVVGKRSWREILIPCFLPVKNSKRKSSNYWLSSKLAFGLGTHYAFGPVYCSMSIPLQWQKLCLLKNYKNIYLKRNVHDSDVVGSGNAAQNQANRVGLRWKFRP